MNTGKLSCNNATLITDPDCSSTVSTGPTAPLVTTQQPAMDAIEFWTKVKDNKVKIYDIENYLFFAKQLPKNYFEEKILKEQVHTVITFDPETYKEKHKIYRQVGKSFSDISAYKLYQFWYFDRN